MKRALNLLARLIAISLIACMQTIRPLLGPDRCRFTLTCTKYAIKQLQEQPLWFALKLICKRLWHCRPFASWSVE